MRRKLVCIGVAVVLLGTIIVAGIVGVLWVLGPPTYDSIRAEDFEREPGGDAVAGRRLAALLCVRCHYNPEDDALAGRALGRYASIGVAHASNITGDDVRGVGAWTDAQLLMLLRSGVHPETRTLVPPYMPFFPNASDVELANLIAFLRSDDPWVRARRTPDPPSTVGFVATLYAWLQWSPGPQRVVAVERPDEADPVAFGRYLANDLLQCHGCHSASLRSVDWVVPEATPGFYEGGAHLEDLAKHTVVAPSLVAPGNDGVGQWDYASFRRALVDGIDDDGRPLRWPMPRYDALTDGEVASLYAYFQSLPASGVAPERPAPYKVVPKIVDPGRHEFERLGCPSCHMPNAEGFLSLQNIGQHFPDDDVLAAYIANPQQVDRHAWMPSFGHLVDDAQMAALVEYVRRRVERGAYAPPPKG